MRLADLQPRTVSLLGAVTQREKYAGGKKHTYSPERKREYHERFKTNNPEAYARIVRKHNLKRSIRDAERHIEKLQAKIVKLRDELGGMK